MNDFYPILSYGHAAQVDDPEVSQTRRNHQVVQAFWVRQVAFVKVEPTTFLVAEEGFDLGTFFYTSAEPHPATRNW